MRADPARESFIVEMRRQGYTMQRIAAHFGITKQRVQQILARVARTSPAGARVACDGSDPEAVQNSDVAGGRTGFGRDDTGPGRACAR